MLADEYERTDKRVGGFALTYTHDLHSLGSRDGAALEKLTELKHTEQEKAQKSGIGQTSAMWCDPPAFVIAELVDRVTGEVETCGTEKTGIACDWRF